MAVAVAACRQLILRPRSTVETIPPRIRRKVLSHNDERGFRVFEVPGVGIFIKVLCGGVGVYSRNILLSPEEVAAFSASGDSALFHLALKIAKGGYEDREWLDGRISAYSKSKINPITRADWLKPAAHLTRLLGRLFGARRR